MLRKRRNGILIPTPAGIEWERCFDLGWPLLHSMEDTSLTLNISPPQGTRQQHRAERKIPKATSGSSQQPNPFKTNQEIKHSRIFPSS